MVTSGQQLRLAAVRLAGVLGALALWATVLLQSAPLLADTYNGGNPTPGPPHAPRLTDEPIQYLTKHYQDGLADRAGRLWLIYRLSGLDNSERGRILEHLVCPGLPDKVLEFPATNIPIGCDRHGRLWEVTRCGLGCTDIATQAFSERYPAPGIPPAQFKQPNPLHGGFEAGFAPVMLEHSSGRLYFLDSYGLHIRDGDAWSYQLFDPPPGRLVSRDQWHGYAPRLVEGPDGAVYAWASGEATAGLWVHEGQVWTHWGGLVCGVVPLAGGRCLVSGSSGGVASVSVWRARPAHGDSDETDATRALLARWASLRHLLTVPRGATFVEGYDRQRKTHVLAMVAPSGEVRELPDDVQLPWTYRRLPQHVVVLADGRVALPTQPLYAWDGRQVSPLFANPLAPGGCCLGVDAEGRLLIDVEGQEIFSGYTRLAVVSPAALAAPPSLSSNVFGPAEAATLDTAGRLWARFPAQGFVSCHMGDQWRHDEPPQGLPPRSPSTYPPASRAQLQALKGGCLVALLPEQGAAFFDGDRWRGYKSLRELVENNRSRLCRVLGGMYEFNAPPPPLALDAGGRIWVSGGVKRDEMQPVGEAAVYDGDQWRDVGRGFLLAPDGRLAVVQGKSGQVTLRDSAVWPARELSAIPKRVFAWSFCNACFDARGQFYACESFNGPAMRWTGAGWDPAAVRGLCMLNDSAGRMWFNGGFAHVTVVSPEGQVGTSYEHPVKMTTPFVEQVPGVYWCAASDGLMQLGVAAGRGGKPAIVVRQRYADLLPPGPVRQLFIDADGRLWMLADRLACVTVPRPDEVARGKEQP